MNLGPTELLIILAIVVILFGVGRVARIGGELGQAVGNFREGIRSAEEKPKNDEIAEENASSRLKASE
ncbi:MAG: twin-arginine translocase TatA/TatE family subunit [Anaerolineaceae bacterium]|nr:twin-arginine translocase TatA/TatE family subunit [Anaerolineaceae bacterium]